MENKHLTLRRWIDKTGAAHVSKLLGIMVPSVYQWRSYHCLPNAYIMKKIIKVSNGAVSYESIIEPYLKANPKKQDN